jgi:hypothetical protein
VLAELDDRYFRDLEGDSLWAFNFIIFKQGDADELAESSQSIMGTRSVNLELELDAGEYVIHVGVIHLKITIAYSSVNFQVRLDRESRDKHVVISLIPGSKCS